MKNYVPYIIAAILGGAIRPTIVAIFNLPYTPSELDLMNIAGTVLAVAAVRVFGEKESRR